MEALPIVVVTHTSDVPVELDIVRDRLSGHAEIRVVPIVNRPPTHQEEDEFIKAIKDARVIFQRPGFISRKMIESCPELKFIITHGAGVDKIDLKACAERDLWVANVPGGNATAVAELAVAGILVLSRRLMIANAVLHSGGWSEGRFVGRELSEGVLGLMGVGYVGRRMVELVSGFGTKVLFYDPYLANEVAEDLRAQGATRCASPEEILSRSDYISIHVPLTKETDKCIGLPEFRKMKRAGIIVNTSRGNVIDEEAMCVALAEGIIAGAVLDVFAVEPLPADSPLRKLDNVILTPHIGGSTQDCLRRIARRACEDILVFLSGKRPVGLVELSGKMNLSSRV